MLTWLTLDQESEGPRGLCLGPAESKFLSFLSPEASTMRSLALSQGAQPWPTPRVTEGL